MEHLIQCRPDVCALRRPPARPLQVTDEENYDGPDITYYFDHQEEPPHGADDDEGGGDVPARADKSVRNVHVTVGAGSKKEGQPKFGFWKTQKGMF